METKENGAASGQTGFRPNSSAISSPVSVSFPLFFCMTVLRECRCTKALGHVAMSFDRSLMCEGRSFSTFEVCQHVFVNLSLPFEGRFSKIS